MKNVIDVFQVYNYIGGSVLNGSCAQSRKSCVINPKYMLERIDMEQVI